jgi:cytoskeletal protein RodZ
MPWLTDEPTSQFAGLPGGPLGDEPPAPAGPPERPRGRTGEHRRDDGPDEPGGRPRWPWMVALGVLGLLGMSGLIWLASGSIPDLGTVRQPVPSQSTDDRLSIADTPLDTLPPVTESAGAVTTNAPFSTQTPGQTPTPTRSPTPSPSASPTTPAVVSVPGVVGKREAAATATLRGAGFAVAVSHATATARRDVNRVISQSPAAGQRARRGATVTIVIGTAATPP